MVEFWVVLVGVVGAAFGWVVGRRGTRRGAVMRAFALVAGIVVLLVTEGPPQRIAAGALVGLVLADVAVGLVRRRQGRAPRSGSDDGVVVT